MNLFLLASGIHSMYTAYIDVLPICREDELSKLSKDLERLPKVASRTSYIERIKEITKNSKKQDADIERILKETRELQLESNSIQERLNRTYAVVDEMVFRYIIFVLTALLLAKCSYPL